MVIKHKSPRMSYLLSIICVSLGLLILLPADIIGAADYLLVESKTVSPGATNEHAGVYFKNELDLQAIALPLMLRALDNGSFVADHLNLELGTRFDTLTPLGIWQFSRRYAVSGTYFTTLHTCAADSLGHTWNPADSGGSLASPEALLWLFVQENDTVSFLAGSDSLPGHGDPSLIIEFGVTDIPGVFEIDTTCIPPHTHMVWALHDGDTRIAPTFMKGIIEIGGPFWNSDSVSGHIAADLGLRESVLITGDLTIDPGVTLTILRGTEVVVSSFADSEASGIDTAKTEIIVYGTLRIDDFSGARPIVQSDSAGAGGWYGIRVMPGGRFETGIGAVIEDAVVGVTVETGAEPCSLSALTVRDCASTGILVRSDEATLVNDTVLHVWPGKGIYADSCNPTIDACLIDSCEYGLYAFLSSATVTDSRIDGPGVHGIYVAAGALYEDTDTLRFRRDTVYGYFSSAQMTVGSISQCRVDSCGFIPDPAGQRSAYGIKAGFGGAVRLRHSTIRDFTTTGFDSYRSGSHLGRDKYENGGINDDGMNSIYADTTGCGGCSLRRAVHSGVFLDTLRADGNWWGASPPSASWFSGKVDYNPYLTAPLGKLSPVDSEEDLASAVPRHHSISQNYPNPFNSSTEIEFALASSEKVKVEVYNILGQAVKTLVDREFTEGTHRVVWDATTRDGQHAASGVYLYQIVAGEFVQSKKMVLLK